MTGSRRLHPVLAAACAAMLATALTVLTAPTPAHAVTVDLGCVGVEEATFDPGLRLFNQLIHFTDHIDYTACTSSSAPTIASGTHDVEADFEDSCLTVFGSGSGEREIVWNTNETSTFTFDYVFSQSGGQAVVTETGVITAGRFAGSDAVETLTGGTINLLHCLFAPGVTDNTTVVSLTVSH
jgi:hypothetical protein